MQKLPDALKLNFTQRLMDRILPKQDQCFYNKWLRYYWGFCYKYHLDPFLSQSLPLFLGKLQEKKQSVQQQDQARFAIGLFYKRDSKPRPSQQNSVPIHAHSYQTQDNKKDYVTLVVRDCDNPDHIVAKNILAKCQVRLN